MKSRSATIADARGIAAAHVASWRAVYRGHVPDAVHDGLDVDQRARAFYERVGFASDGRERTDSGLVGAPLHEVRYVGSVATGPGRE